MKTPLIKTSIAFGVVGFATNAMVFAKTHDWKSAVVSIAVCRAFLSGRTIHKFMKAINLIVLYLTVVNFSHIFKHNNVDMARFRALSDWSITIHAGLVALAMWLCMSLYPASNSFTAAVCLIIMSYGLSVLAIVHISKRL